MPLFIITPLSLCINSLQHIALMSHGLSGDLEEFKKGEVFPELGWSLLGSNDIESLNMCARQ